MNKLEQLVAESVRKYTDANVNKWACHGILYQPKVTEQLKRKLREQGRKREW